MAEVVMILGESGTGKTTAIGKNEELGIIGLNPKETMLYSVVDKGLPTKGWKKHYNSTNKNYYATRNHVLLMKSLMNCKDRPEIKNIVIDDFQYVLSGKFIDDIPRKGGSEGYDKYNEALALVWEFINNPKKLRDDQIVFILSHVETISEDLNKRTRFKAIGKATHRYVTPEGLVSIVLYAEGDMEGDMPKKFFRTQGGNEDSCKSPHGMFPSLTIKNDLGYVAKQIREYYEG